MCFSANASFITAGVLTIIGLISVSISRTRSEQLLSLTAFFFAIQQATEGFLWLNLPSGNTIISTFATYLYLFYVYFFWPLWMPLVVSFYEQDWLRKIAMYICTLAGFFIALYGLQALVINGAYAKIEHLHIQYIFNVPFPFIFGLLLNTLYCIATIIPLLICSRPLVWICGVTLAASYVISQIFYYAFFTSVWCFFGSLTSLLILYIIYYNHTNRKVMKK